MELIQKLAISTLFVFVLSGCAHLQSSTAPKLTTLSTEEKPTGEPLVLIGLNDLQDQIFEQPVSDETHSTNEVPEKGGVARIATALSILKREAKSPPLILDAGNSLSGSFESALDQGQLMTQLYNLWGVQAALVGTEELSLASSVFNHRTQEAHYRWLASNITPMPALTAPIALYQVGHLKVGIFGLVSRHTPLLLSENSNSKIQVKDLTQSAEKSIIELRRAGADVVVLLSQLSVSCAPPSPIFTGGNRKNPSGPWTIKTPQMPCYSFSELSQLIRDLGDRGVDAVISGGSPEVIHHFIQGVPVIQGGMGGQALHSITLYYDFHQKRVLRNFTQIDGPVPICSAVFSKQGDCDINRASPKSGRGRLIKATYHDWSIHEDSEVETLTRNLKSIYLKEAQKKITTLPRPLNHSPGRDSEASHWLAESMLRHSKDADFAIVQTGALRKSLSAGDLTNRELFGALPVDFHPAVLELTGLEVKRLIQILTTGSRGFPGIAGLHVKVIDPQYPALPPNHAGGRKTFPWEVDRVLSIRDSKGLKLKDGKRYTVVTTDFIARGGDDTEPLIKNLSPKHVQILEDSLRQWAKESFIQAPVLATAPPTLAFGLPAAKSVGSRSKKRNRHTSSVAKH